jgi:hypothetical protein
MITADAARELSKYYDSATYFLDCLYKKMLQNMESNAGFIRAATIFVPTPVVKQVEDTLLKFGYTVYAIDHPNGKTIQITW